ncbi:MAG: nucleoside-diphosphate kinase [Myxococcota bacterium]
MAGKILARIEESGLEIVAMKKMQLSEQGAKGFYAVHKARPLRRPGRVHDVGAGRGAGAGKARARSSAGGDLMGPTNSKEAPKGTMRGDFGTDVEQNATHGSDAPETARLEIAYFFNASEICGADEALPA